MTTFLYPKSQRRTKTPRPVIKTPLLTCGLGVQETLKTSQAAAAALGDLLEVEVPIAEAIVLKTQGPENLSWI